MSVTIEDVLSWDVGELGASAARLTEVASNVRSEAGRISPPSSSDFAGASANSVVLESDTLRRNHIEFADRLQSAAASVRSAASQMTHAQQTLRNAKALVTASYPGFDLFPDGTLSKPRPPDLVLSEDGRELRQYDNAVELGTRTAAQARDALAEAEAADRSLASALSDAFGTAPPQDSVQVGWPQLQQAAAAAIGGTPDFLVGVYNSTLGMLVDGVRFSWNSKFQMFVHPDAYVENAVALGLGVYTSGKLLYDDPKEFVKVAVDYDPNNKAKMVGGIVGTLGLALVTGGVSAIGKTAGKAALSTATGAPKKAALKSGYAEYKTQKAAGVSLTSGLTTNAQAAARGGTRKITDYVANPAEFVKDVSKARSFKIAMVGAGASAGVNTAAPDKYDLIRIGAGSQQAAEAAVKQSIEKGDNPVEALRSAAEAADEPSSVNWTATPSGGGESW